MAYDPLDETEEQMDTASGRHGGVIVHHGYMMDDPETGEEVILETCMLIDPATGEIADGPCTGHTDYADFKKQLRDTERAAAGRHVWP